ncbi:MAG: M48 family metalloprotease [Erysipelotrichaceae bacterium]|nr:M48 family metalloprotease [Erysipelotrichaceae bacterium]
MFIKLIVLAITLISLCFEFYEMKLIDAKRKEPLPAEVADIYSPERYQTFLNYKSDYRKVALLKSAVSLIMTMMIFLTPLFHIIESISRHTVYSVFFLTAALIIVLNALITFVFDYYSTFTIEEKYGKNKKTLAIFIKDELLDLVLEVAFTAIIMIPLIYLFEHIDGWTHHFTFTYGQSFLMTLAIFAGIMMIYLILLGISYIAIHVQYEFTDLEEGDLRNKIVALMADSKKKVKLIKVYNESKKSTSKNAFLLKVLWHREFGIADNFLSENAEDELLAVLSHEVGHLKHKKNIHNYIRYLMPVCLFALIVYLIPNGQIIINMNNAVKTAFSLTITNYYLLFLIVSTLLEPIMFLFSLYSNFATRIEEYEADYNAVKEGYGEALIRTFKQLSNDELIDVNPPDLIEFIEFDHPGMYHRIKAIREAEAKLAQS